MKHLMLLLAIVAAPPVVAQTSNDDMPATENWWDKVGADFFSAASMQEPRPETEIRAQWTGLSADDQAAVLARCAGNAGSAGLAPKSTQEGSTDEGNDTTSTDLADDVPEEQVADDPNSQASQATTTTGSVSGEEVQLPAQDGSSAPDTGLAGGDGESETKMVLICDLVPGL